MKRRPITKERKRKKRRKAPKRREVSTPQNKGGGLFFDDEVGDPVEFFTSGCTLLDCVLGQGWAESRIANVVGDKSTGKTLLAIEACANFARKHEHAEIHYNECEDAFDIPYAASVGFPYGRAEMIDHCLTVEDVFEHMDKVIKGKDPSVPCLYVVDSLDAISDRSEQERGIDEGTFGANKAKQMSQLFRRLNRRCHQANMTVLIVSQVRDKIGVMFGKKQTRAGGRALDFYASQVLWLKNKGKIIKTRKGVKRPVGINVAAQAEKLKVGDPYRECDFPIMFGFGIDDVSAGVNWLKSVKRLEDVGLSPSTMTKYLNGLPKLSRGEFEQERENVSEAVRSAWIDIEKAFKPKRRKYE